MRKLLSLMFLLPASLFATGYVDNTGQNLTSVKLSASSSSQISSYYTYNTPGSAFSLTSNVSGPGATVMSAVVTNMTGANYSHMQVINNTQYPLAFTFTKNAEQFPTANLTGPGRNLFVLSSGTGSFDGLPVWNNLYVESANGQSVVSGDVEIMLWGSNNTRGGAN